MAQAFYPNASTIITRALTDLGAVDPEGGITPTTAQLTDGLQVLNFLVTSWIAHGMQVWCQKTGTYTLSNAVGNPTVGPGGTINIARPETVTKAWLRDTTQTSPIDIPVRVISRDEYNDMSQKTVSGVPNALFYDPQYDLPGANSGASAKGQMFLWPVPDTSVSTQYDLYFVYTRPLQDFSATSDSLDFPQEWYDAVRWNLALSLGPSYNVPVMKWKLVKEMADNTLQLALAFDRSDVSITIAPEKDPSSGT
jgi:hypothetical protein